MLKKTIRSVVVGLVGLIAVLYLTGNGFVFQLVAKVLETGRTTAGIDDYLYFDNAWDLYDMRPLSHQQEKETKRIV